MSGYEFDFIVGSGIEKHSGVFLETGIETLLNGYLGEVEIAKLGGAAKPEYVNARDGLLC